jgi:lysophospholipase L1-like esterase
MNQKIKIGAIGICIMILLAGVATYYMSTINIAAAKPIRVACVGDSITQGSGYPQKLQALLGPNYTVVNFGVSGSTVSLNSSKPYMNQTAFKKAEEFDPEIVVIMLGTNDANPEIAHSEDNFEADYAQLVASFEGLEGDPQIWVVKSPPIFSDNSNYNNTYLSHTVLPQIDDLANQLNLPTVDVYSAFGTHSDYFMDGVHPNADGAALIASNICDAITSPDSSFNDSSASGP